MFIVNKTTTLTIALAVPLFLVACSGSTNDPEGSEPGDPADDEGTVEMPGSTVNTAIGDVFTFGEQNKTLYTFANDSAGSSTCFDECLQIWPAITAETEQTMGQFSTITRQDGSFQWSFKNMPLYFYQGDATEGDISGEGLGDVWFVARPDPIGTSTTSLGDVLAGVGSISNDGQDAALRRDVDGYTLYTFRNDTDGTSNCEGGCAQNWPPLFADRGATAGNGLTLISRSDGTQQWAREGLPLYLYQGDGAPGDTNGQGSNGVWDVALPIAR